MTTKEIGEMIRLRRKARGMTQGDLARATGISESAIAMYEQGRRKPNKANVEALADAFNVSKWEIEYREDEVQPIASVPPDVHAISDLYHQRVLMIGEVAAGEPIYAPEEYDMYIGTPIKCDAAITIRGDSMCPNYLDGDIVYVKCTPDVPEGTVAIVFLDNEATIKHVYKRPTGLTLISDNPDYPPLMPEFMDYDNKIRIFGVPVGFTRMYNANPLNKIRKGFR